MNTENILEWEEGKGEEGFEFVVGVDEVGRGALAGPLVVAAVVFNVNHTTAACDPWIQKINDSKKLSASNRELFSKRILETAHHVEIQKVSPRKIDELNIHNATLLAMKNVVNKSLVKLSDKQPMKNVFAFFDGKFLPAGVRCGASAVVSGDSQIFSVACASIVAKVYRDNLMKKLSKSFPEYFWEENKGYGTLKHCEMIGKHGLTPQHRETFCKNFTR